MDNELVGKYMEHLNKISDLSQKTTIDVFTPSARNFETYVKMFAETNSAEVVHCEALANTGYARLENWDSGKTHIMRWKQLSYINYNDIGDYAFVLGTDLLGYEIKELDAAFQIIKSFYTKGAWVV